MRIACALCLLGTAQGCAAIGGTNTVVGNENEALYVGGCTGAQTNCDSDMKTKSVGTHEPLTCQPETGAALEVDWESEFMPTECKDITPYGCAVGLSSIAIDDDGAAWVVANFEPGSPDNGELPYGVWLARYDADGRPTAGTMVVEGPAPTVGHPQFRPDVAVTRTGHALVTVYAVDGGKDSWAEVKQGVLLAEYDKDGTLVGKATTLIGIGGTHVSATSDGSAVTASNAARNDHHGVLAELGADRTLHFSQNRLETFGQAEGAGVSGVSVDRQDRISVLMARGRNGSAAKQHLAFSQFDRQGNMIWDRTLDTEFDEGWAPFGMDGDGNLVMLGHIPGATQDGQEDAIIEKLSASGELLFTMLVSDVHEQQLAVEPGGDNRIFVAGSAIGGGRVKEISADGSRCVLHDIPPGVYFPLYANRGGSLYYLASAQGPGHPSQLARLKPIAHD